MNDNPDGPGEARSLTSRLVGNWVSLTGAVVGGASLFAFLLLFVLDSLAHSSNPYIGVLTYLIAPGFLFTGLGLILVGLWLQRRQEVKATGARQSLRIDFSRARDRRLLVGFGSAAIAFLLLTALGSYQTYHFTESVTFCGQVCHEVMEPEFVTYQNSPHARVSCAQCHIGPGANWYVRSKLSGAYQVYATLANKYPRPVPTPVKNLRPAEETCEQCHWPQKFVGNLDRTYAYYLTDETNTPFTVRMLLRVGGGHPSAGPVEGIHWHMSVGKKVEYYATDEGRQKIPWIRFTDENGVVSEYRAPKFTNTVDPRQVRIMDCIDCHNRPAHIFRPPNEALNLAIRLGRIDATLPFIKSNSLWLLTQRYTNTTEALQKIATTLDRFYPQDARAQKAIPVVQQVYRENFFPKMKASWKEYPNNIGHMNWPGCFRCHDGQHRTADGKKTVRASNCDACHLIVAQGAGTELESLHAKGLKFAHPGDELDENPQCHECHNGGL
jgi:nitrate/TMAO reductase-like tetraheme cytochrome c subunit